MNSAAMMYFANMAKLTMGMNKETTFLMHMLSRMEYHKETSQNIVYLGPAIKRQIVQDISPGCSDKLATAKQYIRRLQSQGRILGIGGSSYVIDPTVFGYAKYVGIGLRRLAGDIYENRIFTDDGIVTEAYIITDDGERIDFI